MPVTLSEIAQMAGVSVSTVSRALNLSDRSVKEVTRNRILQIADELNYKPNLNARGLRRNRSYAIGIVADYIADPFTAQVVSGIADYLRAGAYSTVFVHSRAQDGGNVESDAIGDLTLHSVDGIIFAHARFDTSSKISRQTDKPYVFVNRGFAPGIITVGPDNYYDAQVMTSHLLRLGYRRLAHIRGPDGWPSSRDRAAGFRDMLDLHGIDGEPVIEPAAEWSVDAGYRAMQTLLRHSEALEAVFAASDYLALGAIYAIEATGRRVPEDIAVVGYDDRDLARHVRPALTTIRMPCYEMGLAAAQLLVSQMDQTDPPILTAVRGSLIVRESCGAALRLPGTFPSGVAGVELRSQKVINMPPLSLPLSAVELTDGFWGHLQTVIRAVTLDVVYDQLEARGTMDALKLNWKPGMPKRPHIFWESDLAKWLEAASYILAKHQDERLGQQVDSVISLLGQAQQPDGYLNAYYTVVEPGKRFTNIRDNHELYCAGHLMEAAVAHHEATGKQSLLDIMVRYADLIHAQFGPLPQQRHAYPGHEEIELALVALYRHTGDGRYFELARYFVDERGKQPHFYDLEAHERGEDPADFRHRTYDYNQSHLPLREHREAVGHAVRATYLYAAATDIAHETGDESLAQAIRTVAANLINRRMYVTGGIGSHPDNEGFTRDYDLPNDTAYAETCASIGLFFWMHRMVHLDRDGRYADVMERALYNGILAGMAFDGRSFFYQNVLAVKRGAEQTAFQPYHRQSWFSTSCCPPNVCRLIASLGKYLYSIDGDELLVNLYASNQINCMLGSRALVLRQTTNYPWDGDIHLHIELDAPTVATLHLRIPGWCRKYTLTIGGESTAGVVELGYVSIRREWRTGDDIYLQLEMPVERVYAHPQVMANHGRVALQRGPLVYCVESADNGSDLDNMVLPRDAALETRFVPHLLGGIVIIEAEAFRERRSLDEAEVPFPRAAPYYEPFHLTAIPYYAWDNRDEGDMQVWLREAATD